MRRITEPEAHHGRVDLIEGRFPPGMQTRCSWCGKVKPVTEGEFVLHTVKGTGETRFFRCATCAEAASAA
jgi:hypothetical protein